MSKRFATCVLLSVCFVVCISASADVSDRAVAELGSTFGVPQMNGFVFIDGRYLPPPYTVTRRGNVIFINRVFIEAPVPWAGSAAANEAAGEVLPAAGAAKNAVDADGDFEEEAGETTPALAAKPVAAPRAVRSIDDLFDDDFAEEAPAPAVRDQRLPANDGTLAGGETQKRDKSDAIAQLDRIRKGYETALIQGEIFFFGQRHNRINGNYGTARTLMGVLPKALRNAQSPQDLFQKLTQGGVHFIDISVCTDLFRNKNTFPLLEERLAKIEMTEELEAAKRKPARGW